MARTLVLHLPRPRPLTLRLLPVADGSGALLADGDGRIIVANVPSVGS